MLCQSVCESVCIYYSIAIYQLSNWSEILMTPYLYHLFMKEIFDNFRPKLPTQPARWSLKFEISGSESFTRWLVSLPVSLPVSPPVSLPVSPPVSLPVSPPVSLPVSPPVCLAPVSPPVSLPVSPPVSLPVSPPVSLPVLLPVLPPVSHWVVVRFAGGGDTSPL